MPDRAAIVVLTTDFRPMTGGIAEYLHGLAQDLSSRVPVVVMTTVPQSGAAWPRAYEVRPLAAAPERRVGERPGDAFPPLRKLRTGWYFARLRRQAEWTVAAVASETGGAGLAIVGLWSTESHFWCRACAGAGVPYAIAAHGAEIVAPLYGALPAWRRADFQQARTVIANSTATAALVRERLDLAALPAVVPPVPGPCPARADVERRAAELRRELNPAGRPLVLCLGRLVRRKGFDAVLRSVSALDTAAPLVVVAGEGSERSALERLASELGLADRVRFTGAVDDLTKWALYEICDLFAMPNRTMGGADWEGFGLVFLEAAAAGRPAIGGRSGGVADAVDDGVTGWLIDPESEGELTAAIAQLLGDAGLRQRFGEAGRARVERLRHADGAVDAILQVAGA